MKKYRIILLLNGKYQVQKYWGTASYVMKEKDWYNSLKFRWLWQAKLFVKREIAWERRYEKEEKEANTYKEIIGVYDV